MLPPNIMIYFITGSWARVVEEKNWTRTGPVPNLAKANLYRSHANVIRFPL